MKYFSFFFKDKENKFEKDKEELINNYLKSLVRYENKINNIVVYQSQFFSYIYLNNNLFNLLTKINKVKNEEENEEEVFKNKKNMILQFVLTHQVNYDDFETVFLQYFKINNNDYNVIKEFVKPFYKEKVKENNILKIIVYIFLFSITYIQFYMIIHEFLEINNNEMEYFIHLFIKEKNNKEKMRLIQKELKYEYFDTYLNQLFKIFYLTIHLLKDVTNITYHFDIHNIFELKKEFLKKILKNKII